jgi:amino acid transporter
MLVPLALFILIVHFAVSKKSSLIIRWAAIMALLIIGISVALCLFIIFGEPAAVVVKGPTLNIMPEEEVTPVKEGDPLPLLLFVLLILVFIAFVVYHALREQYRKKPPDKKNKKIKNDK